MASTCDRAPGLRAAARATLSRGILGWVRAPEGHAGWSSEKGLWELDRWRFGGARFLPAGQDGGLARSGGVGRSGGWAPKIVWGSNLSGRGPDVVPEGVGGCEADPWASGPGESEAS